MNVPKEVLLELKEMKKLGMRVPKKALDYVKDVRAAGELNEYYENGMKIGEIASLAVELSDVS